LLGDEVLKGMTLVEQAKHLGDAGRLLEKSPKLAKAVSIGANALRQGTVGGAQTLAHGGTLGDAVTTGVVTGGTGAILEGAAQGVKAVKSFYYARRSNRRTRPKSCQRFDARRYT